MDTESIYDKISRTTPDIRNENGITLSPVSSVIDAYTIQQYVAEIISHF